MHVHRRVLLCPRPRPPLGSLARIHTQKFLFYDNNNEIDKMFACCVASGGIKDEIKFKQVRNNYIIHQKLSSTITC